MRFLLNDRSLHGQYASMDEFKVALGNVFRMRAAVVKSGRALHCSRGLDATEVGPGRSFQSAVQGLPREQRSAVLSWVTRDGPFWEDARAHGGDEYWRWTQGGKDEVVTDTALGEAGSHLLNRNPCTLVSFAPSDFNHTPIHIERVEGQVVEPAQIPNYWAEKELTSALSSLDDAVQSWAGLATYARKHFSRLTFTAQTFAPLEGHPYNQAAADRIRFLLGTLDQMQGCFDTTGKRTPEGHRIYQDFFTGTKEGGGRGAMFSDSSDDEKQHFKDALTFHHPDGNESRLFCPWHGKVQTPQLRVHFSYPISANQPLYVVYVGPKITKR